MGEEEIPAPGDGEGDGSLFPGEGEGDVAPGLGTDDGGSVGGSGDDGGGGGSSTSPVDLTPGPITPCDAMILSKMASYDNLMGDDREKMRFGVSSASDCPDQACTCSEICDSEIHEKGNTYDYSKTLHEQASDAYDAYSAGYYEEFNRLQEEHMAECEAHCEQVREEECGCEMVSGPDVLAPGESAEYVCSDGTTKLITMPEGACGTQTFTVGCCSVDVRATVGQWVFIERENFPVTDCYSHYSTDCVKDIIEGRYKYRIRDSRRTNGVYPRGENCTFTSAKSGCLVDIYGPIPDADAYYEVAEHQDIYEWQC
ncbi:hypothetical protein [Desulfobacula toluolica]|uniref:hypothetical protein n=1 Tax=Desulfobacula toluolica TaxID=28223 RepID=UPI0011D221EB|nr:hypothetical protein [Desulfobacula toluolica]